MKNSEERQAKASWRIVGYFSLAITLICFFVFLYNYSDAYSTPEFSIFKYVMVGHYILLAIFFLFCAVIVKLIFGRRVRLSLLLLSAVLLPTVLYNVNKHTLKEGAVFHFLVEDGGLLHFIPNHDFNFDGMNDEQYRLYYEEREESSGYGGHYNDKYVRLIDTRATGTGAGLNCTFCFYDWEKQIIDLFLEKDVRYKEIRIKVIFRDPEFTEKVSFYLDGRKLDGEIINDITVLIVFDEKICRGWQINSEKDSITIPIEYKFE